jgi:uncharacterized protein DUF6791/ThiF family protein
MSQRLINLSEDLKRLRDEGYDLKVKSNYLIVGSVPYVNSAKKVKLGTLVSELNLAGDVTTKPNTHVAYFIGEHPCNKDGLKMVQIEHQSSEKPLDHSLVVQHSFSSKPKEGYKDYYHKMTTYINIISSPAISIDSTLTARTFPVLVSENGETVFNYIDTASSRAEIISVTRKLELNKIGIVGLGGTGSYVLDLVAKTPVNAICLFDGDKFSQHNAFRSPGAPSVDELAKEPKKVHYLKQIYSKMHGNIVANDFTVDASNIDQLHNMDFIFLCLDKNSVKKLIIDELELHGIPFIDVGMGIELVDNTLHGVLRITTSTDNNRKHVMEKNRIPLLEAEGYDEYSKNIQIADLNSLNAALAVIKWKKLFGFYKDFENEHFSTYTIDGNSLINEDQYESKSETDA